MAGVVVFTITVALWIGSLCARGKFEFESHTPHATLGVLPLHDNAYEEESTIIEKYNHGALNTAKRWHSRQHN